MIVGRLEVEKFDAHADAGLDDADGDKGFQGLTFAGKLHTGTGIYLKRLAGADETPAMGNIGSDTLDVLAGFQINEFDVSGKWKADGIAAVPDTRNPRGRAPTIRHGDDLVHVRQPKRGRRKPCRELASTI